MARDVRPAGTDRGSRVASAADLAVLSIYGLRVACAPPLRSPLPTDTATSTKGMEDRPAPDLVVTAVSEPPVEVTAALRSGDGAAIPRLLWKSPERDSGDLPATILERVGDWDVLRFPHIADFHLRGDRIVVVPAPGASSALVELRLLGPVLAYWLEWAGVPTLHASAVVVDGRAIGFLAGNHAGKTNLALALMDDGGALLTDDLLAVEETLPPPGPASPAAAGAAPAERAAPRPAPASSAPVPPAFLARPGYPQVRLWVPDAERVLPGRARDLPTVHPAYDKRRVPVGEGGVGRFHPAPAPLAALFLPQHRPDVDRPHLERLPPAEALLALLAGSYLPRLAPAAGLQEGRLDRMARLVEAVPVLRLTYPSGLENLPTVVRSVREVLDRRG